MDADLNSVANQYRECNRHKASLHVRQRLQEAQTNRGGTNHETAPVTMALTDKEILAYPIGDDCDTSALLETLSIKSIALL